MVRVKVMWSMTPVSKIHRLGLLPLWGDIGLGCQGKMRDKNNIDFGSGIGMWLLYQAKETLIFLLSETKGIGTWRSCAKCVGIGFGITMAIYLRRLYFCLETWRVSMLHKTSVNNVIGPTTMSANSIGASMGLVHFYLLGGLNLAWE